MAATGRRKTKLSAPDQLFEDWGVAESLRGDFIEDVELLNKEWGHQKFLESFTSKGMRQILIKTRRHNKELIRLLKSIHDKETVDANRVLLALMVADRISPKSKNFRRDELPMLIGMLESLKDKVEFGLESKSANLPPGRSGSEANRLFIKRLAGCYRRYGCGEPGGRGSRFYKSIQNVFGIDPSRYMNPRSITKQGGRIRKKFA